VNNSHATFDVDGNSIIYRSHIDRYGERQRAGLLNIPLTVLYRTGKENRYYASLGLKLGVPVYGKYTGSGGTITASGYYTDYRQEEIWQNDLGYGSFPIQTMEVPLKLKRSYMGTLEAGMKWDIGIGTNLYTGVYMDYGLNDMVRDRGKTRFVEYNYKNPAEPLINGLLTSLHSYSENSRAFVEKVTSLAVGIKLKLAFSTGCSDLLTEKRRYRDMQRFHPVSVSVEPAMDRVSTDIKESTDTIKNDAALPPSEIIITGTTVETTGVNESEKEGTAEYGPDFPAVITIDGYKLGQVAMTPEQKSIPDEYVELLMDNLQAHIEITGHACDTGTKEGNLRIGQQRADNAKDYLTGKGIPPVRIFTYSKGDSEPVHPNSNEESWEKNRRIEIKLYK
jgi:outer membrane protein OmpA-like peptidoglycan-associated protein